MSPSSEHEICKQTLSLLVEMLAEALGVDIQNLGSTTFKRSELERGFEADVCFYVQNAERMQGKIWRYDGERSLSCICPVPSIRNVCIAAPFPKPPQPNPRAWFKGACC
jgi:hypothetical protein